MPKRKRFDSMGATQEPTGFQKTSVNIPDELVYKLEDAKLTYLDVVAYMTKDNHPNLPAGELALERTFWVHSNIGENEMDRYICPAREPGGGKCPICERLKEMERSGEMTSDELYKFAPRRRQLWAIRDTKTKEPWKVWDVSYYLFGKVLNEAVRDLDDDEQDYRYFADTEEGFTLKLGVNEESFRGNKFYSVASVGFKERAKQYTEEQANKIPCLDDFLTIKSYDELANVIANGPIGPLGGHQTPSVDAEYVPDGPAPEVVEETAAGEVIPPPPADDSDDEWSDF